MTILSTLQPQCPFSSRPREAVYIRELGFSLPASAVLLNFIPMKSPKSFPADSRRRKFIMVLPKQFFFSWNSLSIEQKNPVCKFLPFLEAKKPSKPHPLNERMWLSQLVCMRHWLDVCPTWATHGECCVMRRSFMPSAGQTLTFQWPWPQDPRCFGMKEVAYKGCNIQWIFTNSIVLIFESCLVKFLLLTIPCLWCLCLAVWVFVYFFFSHLF